MALDTNDIFIADNRGTTYTASDLLAAAAGSTASAVAFVGVAPFSTDIQAALNTRQDVAVVAGTYTITSTLLAKADGQRVEFLPGVTLVATSGLTCVLRSSDFDDVQFLGNSTEIDLAEFTNLGISMRGVAGYALRPTCKGFWVHGIANPAANNSAIDIRKTEHALVRDVRVSDYGQDMTGGTNVSYGVGFTDCLWPTLENARIENGRVAVEFFDCFDGRVDGLRVETCSDNGIYCTGTIGSRFLFTNMLIDAAEEGVVVNCGDVTISNSVISNCTNKAITARGQANLIVNGVRFLGNKQHVGDDAGGGATDNLTANTNFAFTGCYFGPVSTAGNALNAVQLRKWRFGTFNACTFVSTAQTVAMVVLGGATTAGYGDNVTFNACTFDDVNKTIVAGQGVVRATLSNGFNNNLLLIGCTWNRAVTAVNLFTSAGTPGTGTTILYPTYVDVGTQVTKSVGVAYSVNAATAAGA